MAQHIINNVEFNVPGVRQVLGLDSDYEMAEWVENTILSTIDCVFSEMSHEDENIVIDELVLDLEALNEQDYQSKISELLSRQLKLALAPYVQRSQQSRSTAQYKTAAVPEIQSEVQSEIQLAIQKPKNKIHNNTLQSLVDALSGYSLTIFFRQWKALKISQQPQIQKILLAQLRKIEVRDVVARLFPENIQYDFILILQPSNADKINQLLSSTKVFDTLKNKKSEVQIKTANYTKMRQALIDLSFYYIVFEQGKEFKMENYVRRISHTIAEHTRHSPSDILSQLKNSIQTTGINQSVKNNFHGALSEDNTPADFYREMTSLFDNAGSVNLKQWNTWFGTLKTKYPDLLKRFYKELKQNDNMLTNLSRSLNNASLNNIVEEYLKLAEFYAKTPAEYSGKPHYDSMLSAIKNTADQQIERASFYSQVLNALLHNQLLDLDKFSNKPAENNARNDQLADEQAESTGRAQIKQIISEQDISRLLQEIKDSPRNAALKYRINQLVIQFAMQSQLCEHQVKVDFYHQLSLNQSAEVRVKIDVLFDLVDKKLLAHRNKDTKQGCESETQTQTQLDEAQRALIISVFNNRPWSLIRHHWAQLRSDHSIELCQLLYQQIQKKQARLHIASQFSQLAQGQIIQLLEPQYASSIQALLQQAELFSFIQTRLTDKAGEIPLAHHDSYQTTAVILMSTTLEYLLSIQLTEFNKNSYLHCLLKKMSVYYKLSYQAYIQHFQHAVSTSELPEQVQGQLIQASVAVDEVVYQQSLQPEQPSMEKADELLIPQADQKITAAYRLYHQIQTLIGEATYQHTKISHSVWSSLIKRVARQTRTEPSVKNPSAYSALHPLQRLLRELQLDAAQLRLFVQVLDTESLHLCTGQFMRLTQHIAADDEHALLPAIQQFANRAPNRQVFYQHLLTAIIKSELLDLQKFLDLSSPSGGSNEGVTEQAQAPGSTPAAEFRSEPGFIEESEPESEFLTSELQLLLHRPNVNRYSLQQFLRQRLGKKDELKQLCKLPESLLSELFYQLNVAVYTAAIKLAENLRLATLNIQLRVSPTEINALLWKSMALYMGQYIHGGRQHKTALKNIRSATVTEGYSSIYFSQLCQLSNESPDRIKQIVSQQLVVNQPDLSAAELNNVLAEINALRANDIECSLNETSYAIAEKPAPQKIEQKSATPEAGEILRMAGDALCVGNAGLVLVAAYMPLLFERLSLTDKSAFISEHSAHKAVQLLQYLVYGTAMGCAEASALTCLLCGLEPRADIPPQSALQETETALVDSILDNIIQQWSALGSTSREGLRESFLQRAGVLIYEQEQGWKLIVEKAAFDMLLDRLPWSYSSIKHSFMPELIRVDWRNGET